MISNFRTSYNLRRPLALRFSQIFAGEHMRLHWKVELEFESFQPGGCRLKTRLLGHYSAVTVLRQSIGNLLPHFPYLSLLLFQLCGPVLQRLDGDHHVGLPARLFPSVILLDPCSIALAVYRLILWGSGPRLDCSVVAFALVYGLFNQSPGYLCRVEQIVTY
jgi:hypothetical protein